MLEAVTKDQLNTGLTGQIRFRVADRTLYAYMFGVKRPIAHVMGYFVAVLRERIANFEAPGAGLGPRRQSPPVGCGFDRADARRGRGGRPHSARGLVCSYKDGPAGDDTDRRTCVQRISGLSRVQRRARRYCRAEDGVGISHRGASLRE